MTPKQYKSRFREAMDAYFLVAPDAWFEPSSCTIRDKDRFVSLIDDDDQPSDRATIKSTTGSLARSALK